MESLQALLQKYWLGTITARECNLLMDLLKEKSHDHIECYKNEIVSLQEDQTGFPSLPDAEQLLQGIHLKIQLQEERDKKKAIVRYVFNKIKWAAAAVLIFFFIAKYLPERQANSRGKALPVAVTTTKPGIFLSINNTTNELKQVLLKDGSSVTLYPQSNLSFSDRFNILNRAIALHGKASFKVAKDVQRPFSVLVNNVVTTALGTHFIVDGREENKNISVRLLEGKVRIHQAEKNNGMKPVYLLPGQVCIIERHKMTAVVSSWKDRQIRVPRIEKRRLANASQEESLSLVFDRALLPDVFNTIEKAYNIKIVYDAAVGKTQASFTGDFSPNASLELLLNIICTTNDLSFEKEGNVYFINNL